MNGVPVEGKVVLVTGANRGIGKALAIKALELGAKKVYATARDESKLAEVKAIDSARVVNLTLDVTNSDQVKAAAAAPTDVDIVINNDHPLCVHKLAEIGPNPQHHPLGMPWIGFPHGYDRNPIGAALGR